MCSVLYKGKDDVNYIMFSHLDGPVCLPDIQTDTESSYLCNTDKDVGRLLLQEVMKGIFPGLLEQLMFDGDERGLTETLQGQNHPIGQQAVHQDPAVKLSIVM